MKRGGFEGPINQFSALYPKMQVAAHICCIEVPLARNRDKKFIFSWWGCHVRRKSSVKFAFVKYLVGPQLLLLCYFHCLGTLKISWCSILVFFYVYFSPNFSSLFGNMFNELMWSPSSISICQCKPLKSYFHLLFIITFSMTMCSTGLCWNKRLLQLHQPTVVNSHVTPDRPVRTTSQKLKVNWRYMTLYLLGR